MGGRFILNRKGVAEIAVGPEITAIVGKIAEEGKAIGEGLSQSFRVTGEYADSFEAHVEFKLLPGTSAPRAVGVVENTSDHAVAVEYGYSGSSDAETKTAHRVFGRILAALSG